MSITLVNTLMGPYFYLDGSPDNPINVDTLPVVAWCGEHQHVTLAAPSSSTPQPSAELPKAGATKSTPWSFDLELQAFTQFPARCKALPVDDDTTLYLRYYQPEIGQDIVNYGLFSGEEFEYPYPNKFYDIGIATQRY